MNVVVAVPEELPADVHVLVAVGVPGALWGHRQAALGLPLKVLEGNALLASSNDRSKK